MSANPVDQLARALDATYVVVRGIGADQWTRSTPCTEWNVRELVDHLMRGDRAVAALLRGEQSPADSGRPGADIGEAAAGDVAAAYRESGQQMLAAFGRPGVLEQMITVPFGTVPGTVALHLRITEALVHGWDLAQATGQPMDFPDDLAEQELAFTRGKLGDVPAGRTPFAPPEPVAEDAPAIDRLAACLGRSVATAGGTSG